MEAWSSRRAALALATTGVVATLVGFAMVESARRAITAGVDDPMSAAEVIQLSGHALLILGGALLIWAIFAFVQATRELRSA